MNLPERRYDVIPEHLRRKLSAIEICLLIFLICFVIAIVCSLYSGLSFNHEIISFLFFTVSPIVTVACELSILALCNSMVKFLLLAIIGFQLFNAAAILSATVYVVFVLMIIVTFTEFLVALDYLRKTKIVPEITTVA